MPVRQVAQEQQHVQPEHLPRYTVTDLGLVGPAGPAYTIKNNGLISGAATVMDGANWIPSRNQWRLIGHETLSNGHQETKGGCL